MDFIVAINLISLAIILIALARFFYCRYCMCCKGNDE